MLKNVHRPTTGSDNSGKDINNQKSPEILVEIPPQKYAKKLVKKHTKNKNNPNKDKKNQHYFLRAHARQRARESKSITCSARQRQYWVYHPA